MVRVALPEKPTAWVNIEGFLSTDEGRSPTPPASTSGSRSLSITSPPLTVAKAKRKAASAGREAMRPQRTLPLRVEESAEDVGLFLRHALGTPSGQGTLTFARARRCVPLPLLDQLRPLSDPVCDVSLLELTELCQAPLVASSACASQLIQHVQTEAPSVFALASIHGNQFVAQFALAQFGNTFSRARVSEDEWTITGRARSLAEIPAELFGRLPPPHSSTRSAFRTEPSSQQTRRQRACQIHGRSWRAIFRYVGCRDRPSQHHRPADPSHVLSISRFSSILAAIRIFSSPDKFQYRSVCVVFDPTPL